MRNITKEAHALLVKGTLKGKKRIEESVIDKSMRYATIEGALIGSSNTIINSYLTPFALALGATNIQIGLLNSLKNLGETLAQIPGATLTKHFSRKTIWNYATIISKILWIPIIFLSLLGNSIMLLIGFAALSHFFSALRHPSWTSMMGDLVPQDKRGKYFGKRNMVVGLAGLVTVIIVGNIIGAVGFEFIFAVSVIFGFIAVYYFTRVYESPFAKTYHFSHSISFSPHNLMSAIRINRNFVILTIFLALMNFSMNVAAPFFVVYQLRDLNIGYGFFTIAIAFNALIALISQQYWGKLNDRYGDRKMLAVTSILISLTPLFWLFVSSPAGVILAEGYSGFAVAGFDLIAFNFVLSLTPAEKRPSYVANHAFFKNLAIVAGAFVGGLAAQHFSTSSLFWFAGLQAVFLLSLILRLISLVFISKIKDAAVREDITPVRDILWQVVAVEPVRGISHALHYAVPSQRLEEIRKKLRNR